MQDLDGIVVLDLAGIGPAPRCLRVLSDLGARWVRLLPPRAAGRLLPRWYQYGALRGVEQFEIDLKHPLAAGVFLELVKKADVVVESFRPGTAARLGVGYEQASASNDRIVYCSISGYGQSGDHAGVAGHDLNYQALSGALAGSERRADGGPAMPALAVADAAGGGWHAAIRILAALIARTSSGRGAYLDVSASEGLMHLMSLSIDDYLAGGPLPGPGATLATGRFACYQLYRTADDGWLSVAAIENRFFRNLCHALGLGNDWDSRQFDADAQGDIRAAFAAAFASRTRDEWVRALEGLDVCTEPVLSVDEAIEHAHWRANELIQAYEHPTRGLVRQVKPFGNGSRGEAVAPESTSPAQVLGTFGFERDEVARLRAAGVVS